MQENVFFDPTYRIANNIGRAVGLNQESILILRKNWERNEWELELVPAREVLRITVRKFRSIYILLLGVVAAVVAPIVAYLGLSGRIIGPGMILVPLFLAAFAYVTLKGSKRMRISFECANRTAVFKGSFRSASTQLPVLRQWAERHHVPLAVDFAVPE